MHLRHVVPEVEDKLVPKAKHAPKGRLDDEVQDEYKNIDGRKLSAQPMPCANDRHGEEIDHCGKRAVAEHLPTVCVVAYADREIADKEQEDEEQEHAEEGKYKSV